MKRSERVAFGGLILTAVLTVVGHVTVREWYQPDLRYESGQFYRSTAQAVTSLRLENFGRVDARAIELSVAFPAAIRDISSNPRSPAVRIVGGGAPERSAVVSVDRIVPGEVLFVYFAIEDEDPGVPLSTDDFVTALRFEGGLGQPGVPPSLSPTVLLVLFAGGFGLILGLIYGRIIARSLSDKMDKIEDKVNKDTESIRALIDAHVTRIERTADLWEGFDEVLAAVNRDNEKVPDAIRKFVEGAYQEYKDLDEMGDNS